MKNCFSIKWQQVVIFKIVTCCALAFCSSLTHSQEIPHPFKARYTAEELAATPVKLIPYPQKVTWGTEVKKLESVALDKTSNLSKLMGEELYALLDSRRVELNPEASYKISFDEDNSLAEEAYSIIIDEDGISITSRSETGQYYALKTLKQLLVLENGSATMPFCDISDKPAYPIRGFMIDVGRNYQTMDFLKEQLDIMADYKLNVFHWHLTDRPAWRIESKIYPQLTDPSKHRPTRDPGRYYTYDEIREVIAYAKARMITVIPEIDMPGHSDSFVTSMGFRMESPEGMEALEKILDEFFKEIPREMAPTIHIGSDEVHIPNPEEFISRMVHKVESNDREAIVWSPGLKAGASVIRQAWGTMDTTALTGQLKEIDSRNSYINNGEPMTYINTLFFKPITAAKGNEALGGILCLWPDVNTRRGEDAFMENPVYPGLLAFSWATWTADISSAQQNYWMTLPESGTEPAEYFNAFEAYLMHHKQQSFSNHAFPYFPQSDKEWRLIGPFDNDQGDKLLQSIKPSYSFGGQNWSWKSGRGNTLVIKDRFNLGGYFPQAQPGQSVYALTYIHSEEAREVPTWIGFETPLRANRVYTGIAENGNWDINGGKIWINDQELKGPEWQRPGWKPSKQEGWGSKEDQEIPWTAEELYWTREPAIVHLQKGWNKVLVKIPSSTAYQNWMFTFVPLDMKGLQFSSEFRP
ncbi:family 20 glycosylhydrolase [Echinicola sediminis]